MLYPAQCEKIILFTLAVRALPRNGLLHFHHQLQASEAQNKLKIVIVITKKAKKTSSELYSQPCAAARCPGPPR